MQQASLQQLEDIVEPTAAGWWPPAWPLVLIIALLLIALVLIAVGWWRRHRARKPQRVALKYLAQLNRPSASDITLLCKQVALAYYPREQIAALNSQQWLRFLGAEQQNQYQPLLQQADQLLYRPVDNHLIEQYQQLAQQWIGQAHRTGKGDPRRV